MSLGKRNYIFQVADFIGLFNFEWHSQNASMYFGEIIKNSIDFHFCPGLPCTDQWRPSISDSRQQQYIPRSNVVSVWGNNHANIISFKLIIYCRNGCVVGVGWGGTVRGCWSKFRLDFTVIIIPGSPNSFNFMQFLGKFSKIVCWRPFPPGGLAPPHPPCE